MSYDSLPRAKTQRGAILALLIKAGGAWVPLPEILALGIAQFGARIFSLRRTGFLIENKTERDNFGVVHSWYRLIEKQTSGDWFEDKYGPRPGSTAEQTSRLPLFSEAAPR